MQDRIMLIRRLKTDRTGATALEFALVFPAFILFVFGMISVYSLAATRRAMDFGLERAMRCVAIHCSTGASTVYYNTAGILDPGVGNTANGTFVVSPSTYTQGTTVTVTATYTWSAPANYTWKTAPQFTSLNLTASGQVRVLQ